MGIGRLLGCWIAVHLLRHRGAVVLPITAGQVDPPTPQRSSSPPRRRWCCERQSALAALQPAVPTLRRRRLCRRTQRTGRAPLNRSRSKRGRCRTALDPLPASHRRSGARARLRAIRDLAAVGTSAAESPTPSWLGDHGRRGRSQLGRFCRIGIGRRRSFVAALELRRVADSLAVSGRLAARWRVPPIHDVLGRVRHLRARGLCAWVDMVAALSNRETYCADSGGDCGTLTLQPETSRHAMGENRLVRC